MNNELLFLITKHTDTLIEKTKTKSQETLELKIIKQMEPFLFDPPVNHFEISKWLLAKFSFETNNSTFMQTIVFQSLYQVSGTQNLPKNH